MTDKKIIKKLFTDLLPFKKLLISGILLYIPLTLFNVIQPVLIGYAVSYGMLKEKLFFVYFFACLFFLAVVLLALVELWQGLILQTAGQKFVENLRAQAFAKVQRLPMGLLDNTPVGKLLTRLTNDAESVAELFSMGAIQIIGDLLFLFGTFIMLFLVDIKLSLYAMLILPILLVGLTYFRRWTKKAFVRVRGVLSSLNGFLQEALSGLSTIQMAGRVNENIDDFNKLNQHYLTSNRRAVFLEAAIYSFVDALSYVAIAIVLMGAFNLNLDHALGLGVLVAFLEALGRFFQPIRELSNRYAVFQSALVALDRIYDLLSWPEEEDDEASLEPAELKKEIEFSKVNFSYQSGEQVLFDLSFTVKKGEHLALVGHTGAGKSTIIKLLNRFYQLKHGHILVDGKNINDIPLGLVRKLVSVVPQEVFLFSGTVKDNLCYGNAQASDEEIWQALKTVQLEEEIKNRGGLFSLVETRGQNFSLGERQLLAFARAILADPPIIVLDEATASVDSRTEARLQRATEELLKSRTALVIAHRLSTIEKADKIIVLEKGQVVEEGSHQTLMNKHGLYAAYIAVQQKNRLLA